MPAEAQSPGDLGASSTSELRVDSFHINIGAGDSAIHILSSKSTNILDKRVVQRAILIDGGKTDGSDVKKTVTRTIKEIENLFDCDGDLKFDAFIVTHWDGDHYQGVMAFLLNDMKKQIGGEINASAVELKRAKYKTKTTGARQNQPLSWFFAPYFLDDGKVERMYGANFKVNADQTLLNMTITNINNQEATALMVLNVAADTDDLLGRDMFHPEVAPTVYVQQSKNVDQLLQRKPPGVPNQVAVTGKVPAMYCLAVNERYMPQPNPSPLTETNRTSICLMVVWTGGRCSHYFAGDLENALERNIAAFVNKKVTSMKLSHHGSFGSTPPVLLETFRPTNYFISAGEQYAHPRWEVFGYIYATLPFSLSGSVTRKPLFLSRYPYYLIKDDQNNHNTRIRMSTTEARPGSIFRKLLESLERKSKPRGKQQRQKLSEQLDAISSYDARGEPTGGEVQSRPRKGDLLKRAILKMLFSIFDHLSAQFKTNNEGIAAIGRGILTRRMAPPLITHSETVYVQITSTQHPETDGEVRWVYQGDNWNGKPTSSLELKVFPASTNGNSGGIVMPKTIRQVTAELLDSRIEINCFPLLPKDDGGMQDPTMMSDKPAVPGGVEEEEVMVPGSRAHRRDDSWCHVVPDEHSDGGWDTNSGRSSDEWSRAPSRLSSASMGSEFIVISEAQSRATFDPLPPIVYIKSSALDPKPAIPWDTDPKLIEPEHPLFPFMEALHWRLFILEGELSSGQPLTFAADDRWLAWFAAFFSWNTDVPGSELRPGQALVMKMTTSAWLKDVSSMPGFSIDVPFQTSQRRHILTFSTEQAPNTFEVVLGNGKGIQQSSLALFSMLSNRATLVFGLALADGEAPVKMTVLEVAKLVGMSPESRVGLEMVGGLGLTLDQREDARNAVWFAPTYQQETQLRLQFHIDGKDKFNTWLGGAMKGLTILDMVVVARRAAQFVVMTEDDVAMGAGELTFLAQVAVSTGGAGAPLTFDAGISVSRDQVTLTLMTPSNWAGTSGEDAQVEGDSPLKAIVSWIAGNLDNDNGKEELPLETWLNSAGSALDQKTIQLRHVELELGLKAGGGLDGIRSARVSFEVCFNIGQPSGSGTQAGGGPVVFLLVFGWSKVMGVSLRGSLWAVPSPSPFDVYERALPDWERHRELVPVTKGARRTLDIRTLVAGDVLAGLPRGIPTEIVNAYVELDQTGVSIGGRIRCHDADGDGDAKGPPTLMLESLEVSVRYKWAEKTAAADGKRADLRVSLGVDVLLFRIKDDTEEDEPEVDFPGAQPVARLMGSIIYDHGAGAWHLKAGTTDLTVAHLAQFWVSDQRSDAMQLLGAIKADEITVSYDHSSKEGATLLVTGVLSLGSALKLRLTYTNEGPGEWCFDASLDLELSALKGSWKLGDVLRGVLGDDQALPGLPDAVGDVSFDGPLAEGASLRLVCARSGETTVFVVVASIGAVSFWFLQLSQKGGGVKRLVRVVVSAVSVNVPMVGQLDSPFDKMFYMWVQAGAAKPVEGKDDNAAAAGGVTSVEYEAMKDCLTSRAGIPEVDLLLFKQTWPADKIAPADTVIAAGHHLVVVNRSSAGKSEVVLDHVFSKATSPPNAKALAGDPKNPKAPKDPQDQSPPDKSSKAPFKVTMGPLSVDNIGLWYDGGRIGITLDASLVLGPVGLALLGFRLGAPLKFDAPPAPADLSWDLDGFAVSLRQPPLIIEGALMRQRTETMDTYGGSLLVGFTPWQLQAMGVYATVKKPNAGPVDESGGNGDAFSLASLSHAPFSSHPLAAPDTFTMAFVIVRLNGPLFSFGFADLSGLVAGVGVNSAVLAPTVDQVAEFPLIKDRDGAGDSSPAESPADTMRRLMDGVWFRAAEGLYWGAAGVRITAFSMLAVDAILIARFGQTLAFAIYGLATLDAPSMLSPIKFAHVELGILCTLDTANGVLKLEAQLSPRSFVLAPQCHLTGGMALYAWADGDWALSLGGYHQAFRIPDAYPRPQRLAIAWSLDEFLAITGEAYFAVTPKACMAGGRLSAALSLGALYAYFDATLDMLINLRPFHFQMQCSVTVGVRFTLDLWIVTIRIAVEIGARLDVQGPPFGGVVHVDFWVFGFDVSFSAPPPPPPPLSLPEFWKMVLEAADSPAATVCAARAEPDDDPKADPPACVLTCQSGLEPAPADTASDSPDWIVRAGSFAFVVTFRFAITSATLAETRDTTTKEQPVPISEANRMAYARPMQLTTPLNSAARVAVGSKTPEKSTLHTFSRVADVDAWARAAWRVNPVIKPAQQAIWGKYNPKEDPAAGGNRIDSLLDTTNSNLPLVMGLSIAPPPPELADDAVNKFNVIQDRREPVLSGLTATPRFPPMASPDVAHQPRDGHDLSWNKVADLWRGKAAGSSGGEGGGPVPAPVPEPVPVHAANIWASRLGFPPGSVTGSRPEQLLARFDTMVPALPMVAVGHA